LAASLGTVNRHGEDGAHAAVAGRRICLLRPVNRVLGAWRSLLRPADRRSPERAVPADGESSAQHAIRPDPAAEPSAPWCIRQLGVRRRALGGPHRLLEPPPGTFTARIISAAGRAATSAVGTPARTPGCSRRSRRRLRRNSSAGLGTGRVGSGARRVRSPLDPLAPEPDSSSRELIRCLPNPICRLWRRIRWLRQSMRHLGAVAGGTLAGLAKCAG
jgi:hypothetical protein